MNRITDIQYKKLADSFLIMASIAAGVGLIGCQQEGPAEKAGQKIDKAVAKIGDDMDRTAEKAGDKLDGAKHAAQEKADAAEEYIDDVMITLKIKRALADDITLRDSHIDATTANGVITLTGTVDSQSSLDQASKLATAQEHVQSVVNQLTVKTPLQSQ